MTLDKENYEDVPSHCGNTNCNININIDCNGECENGGDPCENCQDTLSTLECAEGQIPKFVDGAWICADDNEGDGGDVDTNTNITKGYSSFKNICYQFNGADLKGISFVETVTDEITGDIVSTQTIVLGEDGIAIDPILVVECPSSAEFFWQYAGDVCYGDETTQTRVRKYYKINADNNRITPLEYEYRNDQGGVVPIFTVESAIVQCICECKLADECDDKTPPTITINTFGEVHSAPFSIVMNLSEVVIGFDLTDIVVTNGTASFFGGGMNTVASALITPTNPGTVTITIPANSFEDACGNTNQEDVSATVEYQP